MKNIIPLIAIFCLSLSNLNAQDLSKTNEEYSELYRSESLVILSKAVDCMRPSVGINKREIYLKMVNLTSSALEVNWQKELKYGDQCHNCDGNNSELTFKSKIEADSSIEPDCNSFENKDLKIFVEFLNLDNKVKLSDFVIKNIEEIRN
jgi:hypothetical protein